MIDTCKRFGKIVVLIGQIVGGALGLLVAANMLAFPVMLIATAITERDGFPEYLVRPTIIGSYVGAVFAVVLVLFLNDAHDGKHWFGTRRLKIGRRVRRKAGGAITAYPDNWDEIRHRVYERDDYTCANCGEWDIEVHAHHIVPLSVGGSNQLTNLITLCRDCHELLHPHMRDG